jgi:excisionase family DNA binding protein
MTNCEMDGTLTVSSFCKAYSVGRTFAYREIKEGRLSARKAGTKTLILREEAERWAHSLPRLGDAQ